MYRSSLQPTLQQSRLYASALQLAGQRIKHIMLSDGGQASLVLRQFGPLRLGLVAGGPSWISVLAGGAPGELVSELTAKVRTVGVAAFVTNAEAVSHDRCYLNAGHLPLITSQHEARLCLPTTSRLARAALMTKWRNRLVRAETAGLRVTSERFDPAPHEWLLQAEAEQRRNRGYRGHPLWLYKAMARLEPNALRVFIAHRGPSRHAFMLFVAHEGVATYAVGQVDAIGRKYSAHNLLLWRAIEHFIENRFSRLDLGSIETEQNPGLARFKLGTGAHVHARGATFLYTIPTVPLARLSALFTRKASHAAGAQTGLSYH